MAFISMFFAFFVIIIFILAGMFFAGLLFLIIGLVKKKKAKITGKKYYRIFIGLGSFLMGIPLVLVGFVVVSSIVSDIKLEKARQSYESFVDKWKNEDVYSDRAGEEALEWILEAADNKDIDKLTMVFTEEVKGDSRFSRELNEFLDAYPGGLSGLEIDSDGGSNPSGSVDGKKEEYIYYSYKIIKDGEYFYINLGACIHNDYDYSKVGIEYFHIKSERAKVYYQDILEEYSDDEYILAQDEVTGDFTTKRLNGHPIKFYEFDRVITQSKLESAVRISKNIDDLKKGLGEPNLNHLRMREVVYEVKMEDGSTAYAEIGYDYYGRLNDSIYYAEEDEE